MTYIAVLTTASLIVVGALVYFAEMGRLALLTKLSRESGDEAATWFHEPPETAVDTLPDLRDAYQPERDQT